MILLRVLCTVFFTLSLSLGLLQLFAAWARLIPFCLFVVKELVREFFRDSQPLLVSTPSPFLKPPSRGRATRTAAARRERAKRILDPAEQFAVRGQGVVTRGRLGNHAILRRNALRGVRLAVPLIRVCVLYTSAAATTARATVKRTK